MENPWWYILYNFVLWFLAYSLVYTSWSRNKFSIENICKKRIGKYNIVFIIILFYSLFTFFGGDKDVYKEVVEGGYKDSAYYDFYILEKFYVSLADFVNGNFLLWNLLVYGSAILITYETIKRLNIVNYATLIAFIFLVMISYGSTRAVLAYSVFLYGLTFFNNKFLCKVIGFCLIFFSLSLHSSMILPIFLSFFLWVKLTKKRIILLIILFPIVISAFNIFMDFLLNNIMGMSSQSAYKLQTYANQEESSNGPGSMLMWIYTILNYCVSLLILFWALKVELKNMLPPIISKITRLSFILVYVSFIFALSDLPYTIYIRYFSMMPFFIYVTFSYIISSRIISISGIRIYNKIALCRNLLFFFMMMFYEMLK